MHSWITRYGRKAGFAAAGLIVGGVLVTAVSASAADEKTPKPETTSSSDAAKPAGKGPKGSAEQELTGENLAKVKEAVLATYPGATFVRVETDSDGVYEAHIAKADGTPVTVELDTNYAITGEEAGGGHGGHGGPGGRGGVDGERRGGPGGGHDGPGKNGGSHAAPGTSDGTDAPPASTPSTAPSGSPA